MSSKPATLAVTARSTLREGSSGNIHGGQSWGPPWNIDGVPNWAIIDAIAALGVGHVRDAFFVHDETQQEWHQALAERGMGLVLFVPAARAAYVAADVAYLATLPYAGAVKYLCGLNEPNSAGGDTWPLHTVAVQHELYDAARLYFPDAVVVGPALKHEHVADYDADLRTCAAAGIRQWCDMLDFHYYPAMSGPAAIAAERARAEAGYSWPVGIQSETGFTDSQVKDQDLKARFCVETLLRAHVNGMTLTNLYSATDDSTGMFGLIGKPAETAIQALLATEDGGEEFPGWLAQHPEESDCGYVVTSEGGGAWTVYLLRNADPTATLVLPGTGYTVDVGTETIGPRGNERELELLDSMTVVRVSRE